MQHNPVLPVRMWRLRPWSANPLMRGSDRFENALRLVVIAVMLVMVSVAGAAGTARYTEAVEQIRAEDSAKVQIPATVIAEPSAATTQARFRSDDFQAPVKWTYRGESGSATVDVDRTAAVGSQVRVWLGPDGKPTASPRPASAAVSSGINTGVVILLGAWLGGLALVWTINRLLAVGRNAQWDSEWRRISRPIGT